MGVEHRMVAPVTNGRELSKLDLYPGREIKIKYVTAGAVHELVTLVKQVVPFPAGRVVYCGPTTERATIELDLYSYDDTQDEVRLDLDEADRE